MGKRRVQILLRILYRILGAALGFVMLCVIGLADYDKSMSHVPLEFNDVRYGTLSDAMANPDILFVEVKEGYKCSMRKNEDGKIVLSLDYGYATQKDYQGIKLHFYKTEIEHQKSDFEKELYQDLTLEEQAKVDNMMENKVRINFVSKIIRDLGHNSDYGSTITINNQYYSFVSEEGKEYPAQTSSFEDSSPGDSDYAYEYLDTNNGYACSIILGAPSDTIGFSDSFLGNCTLIFDGYLETSLDYEGAGINYSLFNSSVTIWENLIVKQLQSYHIIQIIIILLIASSVWSWPGVFRAIINLAQEGFDTLKEEGLGEIVYITKTTYVNYYGSRKVDYEYGYKNDGVFLGSIIMFILALPLTPICGTIKSVVTIFTDIFFFFYE